MVSELDGGVKGALERALKYGNLQYKIPCALFDKMGYSNHELQDLEVRNRVYRYLKKHYSVFLSNSNYENKDSGETSNKVWICWFQGIENAPELVKCCVESIRKNLISKEIIVITAENMLNYVQFPSFIMEKWENGQITYTHMTDLLRLELLIKYGGTWIDATVFCSAKEDNISPYFLNSDLFFFQSLKPGRDGHSHINSSWYITAKSNSKYLMACRHLCYEYWKEHNSMVDYFLLHDFMSICLEFYPEIAKAIVPRDNATPHILLLRLFDEYNEEMWEAINQQTPFHKLSYKFDASKKELKGTYYKALFEMR